MRPFTVFLLAAASAVSGLGAKPEAVLVIVNENSPVSRSVAEYYSRKRAIPRSRVCSIHTTTEETVTREKYLQEIERPVGDCLKSRQLTESVLYLVTTLGVPLRVRGRVGLEGDNASVDSELTLLYGRLHGAAYPAEGAVPNPFFNRPHLALRHPEVPLYLVTRLAAYDFAGVRGLIDRSLAARNRGRFVLDARSGSDKDGDNWLKDAAIALPSNRTVYEATGKVLYGEKDVVGYASWGSNDPERKGRTARFGWAPGAVMVEYVSTNARTFSRPPPTWTPGKWSDDAKTWHAGSPQTLIGDYIEEGVTGVAGNIDEPYLQMTVRPHVLFKAWIGGRNLAESFFLATPVLSWQNIVIGDPLCSLGRE